MPSTIKLSRETKEMIRSLKNNPRETYEDVIRRLIAQTGAVLSSRMQEKAVSYLVSRGVKNIAMFGSQARGDSKVGSDLDLLVDFPPGTSLFDHVEMEMNLSALLGVKVELVSRRALSPYMRREIEREAVSLG